MKNIGLYLKSRIKIIILIVLIGMVQVVVFYLYSVPVAPILYSFEMLAFVFAVTMLLDFLCFVRKHKELQHSLACEETLQVELSETGNRIEQDYQELITKLISEKYQMNELRVKSLTELKDYYATWAHQIKTPIAAMDMLLQSQEESPVDFDELKRQLFKIDFYVDAVMNYLRLEDMSSDYTFEEYSVDRIVRKAVKKFASQFIGKKISVNLANLDYQVKTDEKWLGFIVEQLLSNAVKYTGVGGAIHIYMKSYESDHKKRTGGSVEQVLVIKDNGIGIEPEDLPRICERGYTGYNGRMDKKSSGIGLYLCKKAADRLNIQLDIQSTSGKGTCVYIDLTQKHTEHE